MNRMKEWKGINFFKKNWNKKKKKKKKKRKKNSYLLPTKLAKQLAKKYPEKKNCDFF